MILIATHDSPACRRAVERAAELFCHADIVVATVVPRLRPADHQAHVTVQAAIEELTRTAAVETLRRACEVLGPRARARLLSGDTAPSLCELARAEGADAIVVGSLAGGGVLGFARGSVATQIAQRAPCSVIELGR